MPAYSHFDYYLRSITATVLALVILGVAGWQVLHGGAVVGPFKDWAGIIIGVYFGQHISLNGSGARKRVAEAQAVQPVQVVHVPVAAPPVTAPAADKDDTP